MDRRAFIGEIALAALGTMANAHAQQLGGIRHVGLLREGVPTSAEPLVNALRAVGWIENQNVAFQPRYASHAKELPGFAAELVRRRVDLIFAIGTRPTRAAQQATALIPIVFSVGGDPVETGLVASLARPGGNLTGFALGLYGEKQLQVLKSAVPGITNVAFPFARGFAPGEVAIGLPTAMAAKALGVVLQGVEIVDADDFASFFAAARQSGADAVLVRDIALLSPRLARIGVEASKSGMPAIGFRRTFAESGGLLSYGPLLSEQYARVAIQINKILSGVKPADLPVEQPSRFELVINLKEAKALGVSIPRLVRLSADELIE